MARRASLMGAGERKSISATQSGRTSAGYCVHLSELGWRRSMISAKVKVMLFFIGDDHAIAYGGKGNDPIGIGCNVPRKAADGFGGFFMVVRIKDLSVPDHI